MPPCSRSAWRWSTRSTSEPPPAVWSPTRSIARRSNALCSTPSPDAVRRHRCTSLPCRSVAGVTASARDLARWSETLAAIARTGLGFTQSLYERERFEEVLHVAGDIKAAAREMAEAVEVQRETDHFVQEWMESIGEGVPGYVTPKVAIGAIVGNDRGELLLVQRKDAGIWLYPTGWADVGYSPAEVAVK